MEPGRSLTLDKNSFFENREFIRLADTGEFLEETVAESGSTLHRLYRFWCFPEGRVDYFLNISEC